MNINYIFKKSKEKAVSEMVTDASQKYYSMIKNIEDSDMKMFFISIISEISNSIFDFYIDLNRTNNIFYNNINKLSEKLIKDIFVLNITYYVLKLLEFDENVNKDEFLKLIFDIFKLSKKERKVFNKYISDYTMDKEEFMIDFIRVFSKKIFSTKSINRMEFIYIDHYLESSYNSFYASYVSVIA